MAQAGRWAMIASLVILAAAMRWLPHPPNFTPILALFVFSSFVTKNRGVALLLPLAVVFVSDLVLGFYQGAALVYLSYVLTGFILLAMGRTGLSQGLKSWVRYGSAAVVASVVFFFASNFAVWASGMLYPKTLEGLWMCYVAALPFFHNTLFSTLLYSAGLAVVWEGVPTLVAARRLKA